MSIAFRAKAWAPMEGKGWTFVTMPRSASAKLPSRGRVPIEGTINGFQFRSSAFPDGDGSHQIQVNLEMKKGAGVKVGDVAAFVITPASDDVAVHAPAALLVAIHANAGAKAQWDAITPKARAEWVSWIASAKKEETRERRVATAAERLAGGAKRPGD